MNYSDSEVATKNAKIDVYNAQMEIEEKRLGINLQK